jgi:hypothetical protein
MIGFIAKIVDQIHTEMDPRYALAKGQARIEVVNIQVKAVAALVISVAFNVMGFAIAAGGDTPGAFLILVFLPIGYAAYNIYKVGENFKPFLDNPKQYITTLGGNLEQDKLKAQLLQGTICCECFVDIIVLNLAVRPRG